MPRPKKCRLISNFPDITIYKPSGVAMTELETVVLNFDELEALRFADFDCKKQVEAAELMNISRSTFGRIIEIARYKVADSILNGKALLIKGGDFCHQDISNNENELINKFLVERRKNCMSCPKFNNVVDSSKIVN